MNLTKCGVIGCLRLARYTVVLEFPFQRIGKWTQQPYLLDAAPFAVTAGDPICKECADARTWIGDWLPAKRFKEMKERTVHPMGGVLASIEHARIKLFPYPNWKADQSGHMTVLDLSEPGDIEVIERLAIPKGLRQ